MAQSKKVVKPVAGKVYFVTDEKDFSEINLLDSYKLYLSDRINCCWCLTYDNFYQALIDRDDWNNYFEVIYEEDD